MESRGRDDEIDDDDDKERVHQLVTLKQCDRTVCTTTT